MTLRKTIIDNSVKCTTRRENARSADMLYFFQKNTKRITRKKNTSNNQLSLSQILPGAGFRIVKGVQSTFFGSFRTND